MQADGRLIQNIQHTHQRRADLGSQADTLALTAGQCRGAAAEGQILQTHIHQKSQSGLDLTDDLLCNHGHIAAQFQIIHELQTLPDAHTAEIHNADAANRDRSGDFRKAVTMAVGTGCGGHTLFQFLPGRIRLGLPIPAADIIENSLKGLFQDAHTVTPVIGHPQFLAFCTVEDNIHCLTGQGTDRCGQREVVFLCQCLKIHPENGVRTGRTPTAGLNGAVKNGLALIRDHQIFVRHQLEAQAGTMGTGTGGIVEGKHSGFQLRHADTAIVAGIILRETQLFFLIRKLDDDQSAGVIAGGFNGVGKTAALTLPDHQAVHHQLDGVLLVLFQLDLFA